MSVWVLVTATVSMSGIIATKFRINCNLRNVVFVISGQPEIEIGFLERCKFRFRLWLMNCRTISSSILQWFASNFCFFPVASDRTQLCLLNRQWLHYSARSGGSIEVERAEAWAWRAESRCGVPDRRPGVFEHWRHLVWLLCHLNNVWRLQHQSMDKCKWQNDCEGLHSFTKHHAQRKMLK